MLGTAVPFVCYSGQGYSAFRRRSRHLGGGYCAP